MTGTIRAEIADSSEASAEGIAVLGKYAPVLALCRALIEAGHDPRRPLEAYRGSTPCLRVRSLAAGAKLCVRDTPSGRPIFARYGTIDPAQGARQPMRIASRARSLASEAA